MPVAALPPVKDQLTALKSGRPWQEIFPKAVLADDQGTSEQRDDEALIAVYRECLVRGLTHHAAPEEFLEACKRLAKLLFRYGRAREANNFLLQLRDLSPDPKQVPTWAWSYSAKLAYLEDIEYCTRQPDEVLDHIKQALTSESGNPQALAVLADFINSSTAYLSTGKDQESASRFSGALSDFFTRYRVPVTEALKGSLEGLDDLVDALTDQGEPLAAEARVAAPKEPRSEAIPHEPDLRPAVEQPEQMQAENRLLSDRNLELELQIEFQRGELDRQVAANAELQARLGELETYLELARAPTQAVPAATGEPALVRPPSGAITGAILPPRSRILVIGESRVPEQHLLGICRTLQLEKGQVELRLSYHAFDTLEIETLKYNDSIAGILVGPVPHKVPGKDDPANALISEKGFPPTIKILTNTGELKITKSSFRDSMRKLLTEIASLDPTIH